MRILKYFLLLLLLAGCSPRQSETSVDFYQSEFFHDVQIAAVFPDSKTFVDCTPKEPIEEIITDYTNSKSKTGFDIKTFVLDHFYLPARSVSNFSSDESVTTAQHISRLWPVLTRKQDAFHAGSSLIPLPHPYLVPGGRFSEIYYWDSYFTLLGIQAEGDTDMIRNMVQNFAFLIDSLGHIPNGNRSYYVSRSQPPFFSLMVELLAESDSTALVTFLPELKKEHDFWMSGADSLSKPGDATKRVVMMPDGSILNRYWDDLATPRPESYKEDVLLKEKSGRKDGDIYREIRAAAESGWDFSSRWFILGEGLASIHTTDIVPPDLNSLLYHLEIMLSRGFEQNDATLAATYSQMAEARKQAILSFMWNSEKNFFMDFNSRTNQQTEVESLAGMYPLFFNIASEETANKATRTLYDHFLKPGGLITTLNDTGEQWDAPNAWAPLQWISYTGLKNYHQDSIALEVRRRWLHTNEKVFHHTGKMMEKYNAMDTTLAGGGGEYPNQDGFGWTNGVFMALQQRE